MIYNSVIVRYGEISLKGKNRHVFEQKLKNDIKEYLFTQNIDYSDVSIKRGRIYIHNIKELPELKKVLGVYSYSPALKIPRDFYSLEKEVHLFLPRVKEAKSFRTSCQRVDKTFPMTSVAIEKQIGEILYEATHTPVNLREPDLECHIEIGQEGIYLFYEKIPAYGGMPFGTAGKLVSLVSSGIDSPVATFLMMKRGVEPILLHFQLNESDVEKVRQLRDQLKQYASGREIKLIVIPRSEIFKEKFNKLYDNPRYHSFVCVICKYLMHKKAGEVIRQENALGLITGDNLAQVASQTLENLYAYHTTSEFPVYSPLISFEKQQTIAIAREIGTYDISIQSTYGCTPPKTPKTRVAKDVLQRILEETGLA